MILLYLLIGLLSLYYFRAGRYDRYLVANMALMTNCFMLLPATSGLRGTDISLVISILIICLNAGRQKPKSDGSDKFKKYVLLIILFSIFELGYTILSGAESISWALKVVRVPLLISTYFVIRLIPIEYIRKFLKYAFAITVIDSILFLLEFLGIDTLPDVDPSKGLSLLGFASECNTPILSFVFLFCCMSNRIVTKRRILFLILFLSILLLTFVRTYLLAFIVCAFLYLFIQKSDRNLIFKYVIAAVFLYPVMTFVFNSKDAAAGADSGSDFKNIVSGDFLDPTTNINCANGTFAFRISMLAERVQYLTSNPKYLLFGVGLIHEDSPNCFNRFKFVLGSPNSGRVNGICIIESGDDTWVPIVLRYGLLGTVLYVYFFIIVYRNTRNRKDEYIILAPIALFYFLISFSGPFFDRSDFYIIICLILGLLSRLDYEDKFKQGNYS